MQDFEDWKTSWLVGIGRDCLNRANLNELWRYRRRLLTSTQDGLLRIVQDKIDLQPEKFARERQDYAEMAGLVLMSNWDRIIDFCTCMDREARLDYGLMKVDKEHPDRRWGQPNCRQWRFCAHCAWRREMDLQNRFLDVFDEGQWFWLTASFTGNLPMLSGYLNRNHPLFSHADLVAYYEAIRFAVDSMVENGVFLGAILTEELHLEELYPLPLVTPHSHIVVHAANSITEADLDHFKSLLLNSCGRTWDVAADSANHPAWQKYLRQRQLFKRGVIKTRPRRPPPTMVPDARLIIELPISLDLKPLPTQQDFSAVLGYPLKPVRLPSVYQRTRATLILEHPQDLQLLAQNVDEFIVGCDLLLSQLRSPVYYGACDPRRKRGTPYIGAPGALLADRDHRNETKASLFNLNAKTKGVTPA